MKSKKFSMADKKALSAWAREERNFLAKLKSPEKIQHYLDNIPYNSDDQCRSPRRVMRDRRAHCMEGALFAAAALRFHGYGCRLMDMAAVRDDDHVIALFKQHGCWGGVAKSNFSGIRFREPVYRSLRELVMSYFENYFNKAGEKTLRAYSSPVDLRRFDGINWMTTEEDLEVIGDYLDSVPHTSILTPAMQRSLRKVDKRMYRAGMLGVDPKGLYKV